MLINYLYQNRIESTLIYFLRKNKFGIYLSLMLFVIALFIIIFIFIKI